MSSQTTEQAVAAVLTVDRQPALRVLFAGEEGPSLRPPLLLSPGPTVLGRLLPDSGVGLAIASDRQLSRQHAIVTVDAAGVHIADAGSRNGIFVNGQSVRHATLQDGDIVRLGNSFVLFRHEPLAARDAKIDGLLGRAPAMRSLRHAIAQVAPTRAMVLLLGESGSGKEVTARALHRHSGRSGPFVAVNCAAIPESLAESQLFGHTRGAFTGATAHDGFFRAAHGGTLFLDEVGELSPTLQPKLLRALAEQSVLPVGATQPVAVDVRILAATNRALGQAVGAGSFRGDLLARLAEFTLELPPLAQRREDILPLLLLALGESPPALQPELVERLLLYRWPFNVREVMKLGTELQIKGAGLKVLGPELIEGHLALTAAVVAPATATPAGASSAGGLAEPVSSASVARPSSVVPSSPAAAPPAAAPARSAASERGPIPSQAELQALLRKHHGVVAHIAREMGRSRTQVLRWLQQRGLRADDYRREGS